MFIKRILVPIDGSELTERAIPESVALAAQLGAAIVGFVAEPEPSAPLVPLMRAPTDDELLEHEALTAAHARPLLQRFQEAAQQAGVTFEGVFEQVKRIDKAIIAAAESHGCDMILMVSHGRGPFGEFLFGSQTKAVLAGSRLPLLVLR